MTNYISKKSWWETILIENVPIDVKIDTGAETNLLPYDVVKQFNHLNFKNTNAMLEANGGTTISHIGSCLLECNFKSKIIK